MTHYFKNNTLIKKVKAMKLSQLHIHIDSDELILMEAGVDQMTKSVEMQQQVITSIHDTVG